MAVASWLCKQDLLLVLGLLGQLQVQSLGALVNITFHTVDCKTFPAGLELHQGSMYVP